jgi:hypothetical protein
MKSLSLSLAVALTLGCVLAFPVAAQDTIFRCGNEYTNNATDAKARGCKTLQGGNVTVIPGVRPVPPPAGPKASTASASSPPGSPRVDPNDQRNRDNGARAILESELKRTENRLTELQKEYNHGEPEKQGAEGRNHQKYLDRVAELKASITRSEEDIAGLKREMARLPSGK